MLLIEKNKNRAEQAMIEEMQKENSKLKANSEQLQKQTKMQLDQKE